MIWNGQGTCQDDCDTPCAPEDSCAADGCTESWLCVPTLGECENGSVCEPGEHFVTHPCASQAACSYLECEVSPGSWEDPGYNLNAFCDRVCVCLNRTCVEPWNPDAG